MSQTFVRLYMGVVAFLIATGFLAFTFLSWGQSSFTSKDFEEGFGLGPVLVADSLATSQNPQLELFALKAAYGYDFEIEATSNLPKDAARRLAAGTSIAVHIQDGNAHSLATLINPDEALVLDLGQFKEPGTGRYFVTVVLVLVLLALGILLILIPFGKQMRSLQKAAEDIAGGDFAVRVEESGIAERQAVARAFNLMSLRIQEQMEEQRQLFRALSHELRTPLARMRFRVELVESSESSAGRLEISEALDRDLALINGLVDELLTHARLESGTPITTERLDLGQELQAVVSERLVTNEVEVSLAIEGNPTIVANSRLFRRAIGNLLSNAIPFAKSAVDIHVREYEHGIEIDIIDDGPGIPKPDRKRIFRAFERLEPESEQSGTGLGLAIVEGIIHAHAGQVEVVDSQIGTVMRTQWPTKNTAL